MTKPATTPVRTTNDLKPGHWMTRQMPAGTSLRGYAEDRAISVLTRAAQEAIDAAGLSRADVARILGTTKSHVSQVLNGSANMTLKTLGALLWVGGRQIAGLESEEMGKLTQRDNTLHFTVGYTTGPDPISGLGSGANVRRVAHG